MQSKLNSREKAYYWFGFFKAFSLVRNILFKEKPGSRLKEGLDKAQTELRASELILFEELLFHYRTDQITAMIKNDYLEPEPLHKTKGVTDGAWSRKGAEEKAPKGQAGFILYKLGAGLWALKQEGEDE
jgi:hypothetical protein